LLLEINQVQYLDFLNLNEELVFSLNEGNKLLLLYQEQAIFSVTILV